MKKMHVSPKSGKIVDFEPIKEEFSKYLLADGNVLKLKVVLLKVKRTDKINPDGTPLYNFSTQVVATVTTADELKWNGKTLRSR